MFGSIFTKTLYDKRWFFWGWTLGSVALLALTAAFFPVLKENGIDQMFKNIPASLQSVIGSMTDYGTFSGFVGSAVYGLRATMLFVPMAIILGYSLSVGEESSGRLYQLLAQPVSRSKNILQKYLAGIWLVFWINVFAAGSVWAVAIAVNETIGSDVILKIAAMSSLFSIAIYSVTYGLGAAFGKKGIALMVPIIWVMSSMLIDAFASQISQIKDIDFISINTYYRTPSLVHNAIDIYHVIVLSCISIGSLLIGWFAFLRRDIKGE